MACTSVALDYGVLEVIKTHYVWLNANEIFGMVGRCGGGYNTVWEDWTDNGRLARERIIKQFEDGINNICGHYARLEESILAEGIRNPVVITCGKPLRRKLAHLPPEMLSQPAHSMLLLEGTTGGSRLWVAQQHDMLVPCIVNDQTGRFSECNRVMVADDALKYYKDRPSSVLFDRKYGYVERFDEKKVGYHLGLEWSEDKIIIQRAPLWVKIMNDNGYYVDRLPAFVNQILADAGVFQPDDLKKRFDAGL